MQPEVKKDLGRDVMVTGIPRIVLGGPQDPYKLEVTITRQTEILPPGLIEIHIDKSPQVPEKRGVDVMQHALIDMFGNNPPYHIITLPNGEDVPACDWFDHTGKFQQLRGLNDELKDHIKKSAGAGWGNNSLWLVLNRAESDRRVAVLRWVTEKLWGYLLGRHKSLKSP